MKSAKMLAILVVALGLMVWLAEVTEAAPMGTAWTYQGRLMDKNKPAAGLYDFQFKLFDDANTITGNQLGSPIDINDLDVIDGHFVVELDFGSGIFDGNAVWLETRVVESPLGSDPCTLEPRLELTPTPYAFYAVAATSLNAADGTPPNVVYVDEVGNVGISTMSPGAKLDVAGNQNIGGDLNFSELLSTIGFAKDGQINLDGNLTVTSALSGAIVAGTSMKLEAGSTMDLRSGAAMTITTPLLDIAAPVNVQSNLSVDGQVGIGTTNPDRNLDIRHSNTGGGIEIDRSVNTIWSGLVYENNGAENWFIGLQAGSDDLLFKDNAAGISMVIEDGTGKVGIGTTSPRQKLEVAGYAMADRFIDGGNTSYYLDPAGTSVCKFIQATAYFDKDDTSYYVAPGNTGTSARLKGDFYVYGLVEMRDVYNTNLSGRSVYVNSSGRLGSLSSSKRYKENIAPLQDDSSKILQAQPVAFTWKESKEGGIGLIAEDMDELGLRNLVIYDNEGRPDSVRYEFISLYLLEVVKEQASSIKELKAENESLKEQLRAENQSLKQRFEALERKIDQYQFAFAKGVEQ